TAGDLRSFVKFFVYDQFFKQAGPDDIGPLTDDDRTFFIGNLKRLDSRHVGATTLLGCSGLLSMREIHKGLDMRRRRATTSPDQIDPTEVDKSAGGLAHKRRGFDVATVFIGKSGVGYARDGPRRVFRKLPEMIGHKLRTRGTVESDI